MVSSKSPWYEKSSQQDWLDANEGWKTISKPIHHSEDSTTARPGDDPRDPKAVRESVEYSSDYGEKYRLRDARYSSLQVFKLAKSTTPQIKQEPLTTSQCFIGHLAKYPGMYSATFMRCRVQISG